MNTLAKIISIAVALLFSTECCLSYAQDNQPIYTVTEITPAMTFGLNAHGQVLGFDYNSLGYSFPFIVSGGNTTTIPTPSNASSNGAGINFFGQVTGFTQTTPNPGRAFLYTHGTIRLIDTLGGAKNGGTALNNLGCVTGGSDTSNGEAHAFLYSPFTGKVKDLGTLGGAYSVGLGINDLGQVTGESDTATGESFAFIYSAGKMTSLGGFNGNQSWAYSINNWGQVTGASMVDPEQGFYHAFIYAGGLMKDLGTLGNGNYSDGVSINNFGQVTGHSYRSDGIQLGFLYTNGRMYDLNDLLAPADSSWIISAGTCINDRGQILCDAYNAEGDSRSVVLTPIRASAGTNR